MKTSLSLILKKKNKELFSIKNIKYKKQKNSLEFEENNIKYKIIYDLNNVILYRENKEFKFKLDIMNKSCEYTLLETNTTLNIKVIKSDYKITKNNIEIIYELETEPIENNIIITINEGELL